MSLLRGGGDRLTTTEINARGAEIVRSVRARRVGLQELADRRGRAGRTARIHRPVVDLAPDLVGDRRGDLSGAVGGEVHRSPCAVALEPVTHVEVLLEVMTEREV